MTLVRFHKRKWPLEFQTKASFLQGNKYFVMLSLKTLFCALLATLCLAKEDQTDLLVQNGGSHLYDKRGRLSVNPAANMKIKIDAGWYSFAYGPTGSIAYRSFGVNNGQLSILHLQSCFCEGNYFSVYDNGQPIINTNVFPVVAPEPSPDCSDFQDDPNVCFDNIDLFTFGSAVLLPGVHNITIVATRSPYNGGTAFLRVDTACTQPGVEPFPCSYGSPLWQTSILA